MGADPPLCKRCEPPLNIAVKIARVSLSCRFARQAPRSSLANKPPVTFARALVGKV